MGQLGLFESTDVVVTDDERGRVAYVPRFVDAARAHAWFAELRAGVSWKSERRMMYDREVDVPRLMSHFRLDPPPEGLPRAIGDAAQLVVDRLDVPFNSVGLNLYRDGRDSVAWHGDYVARKMERSIMATLSLGGPRGFRLRPKGGGRSVALSLGAGDLLVMGGTIQRTWDHAVPKVKRAAPRIAVMFRPVWLDE